MKAIRRPDQYLRLRGDIWHYVRRVPKAVSHIDDRTLIYRSLDTDSRKVARQRRDICADADEQRWHEIAPRRFNTAPREASYRDVIHHARALGFNYEPVDSLIARDTVTDLLNRLQAIAPLQEAPQPKEAQDAEALLGVAKTPSATITQAMDLYLSEIVADELASKSPEQVKNFSKINRQGALLCMALIETGCRPSELANITPENIRLDAEVPHIRIRPTKDRELKSGASVRDIPLVGVALEAMRQAPNGFPHYRDRSYLLSASLTKAFKARGLFPTKQHRIYSFRHSFEKRMLEGGLDYGLRCSLMGHRNPRPEYGDGGSLKYRRDEMMKIAHPLGEELFGSYPFKR